MQIIKDQDFIVAETPDTATPVDLVTTGGLDAWQDAQGAPAARWAKASGFRAATDQVLPVPGPDGGLARVAMGVGDGLAVEGDPWAFARLAGAVPAGCYRVADDLSPAAAYHAALGWALGQYRFTRYRDCTKNGDLRQLVAPAGADMARIGRMIRAATMVRDLINTPTNDMGPDELESAMREVADVCGAQMQAVTGDALLERNFPLIHAVGRASDRAPRLLVLTWGDAEATSVRLVG
ncbi:MAG: leucyl aminopeptidase family protein, partial [Sphingomonadales bacterium]